MKTCPYCKHQELEGALFCSKCGIQLVFMDTSITNVIESSIFEFDEKIEIPPFPTPPADAAGSILALLILTNGLVLYLQGKEIFTIGRSTKGQTIIPDIDLYPYYAYESGVSRLHANIQIKKSSISIVDLGSANGTRLNGELIQPHTEQPLNHGDTLLFGHFKVQILIKNNSGAKNDGN